MESNDMYRYYKQNRLENIFSQYTVSRRIEETVPYEQALITQILEILYNKQRKIMIRKDTIKSNLT